MSRIRRGLRKLTRLPGMPQARHVAERSVAPYLRHDLHLLGVDHGLTVQRLAALELKVAALDALVSPTQNAISDRLRGLEVHLPTVLNAISSTNGTSRQLARRNAELEDRLEQHRLQLLDLSTEQQLLSTEQQLLSTEQQLLDEHGKQLLDEQGKQLQGLADWVRNDSARIDQVASAVPTSAEDVRVEMRPHIETLGWLLSRVETIRAEVMHELRYGPQPDAPNAEVKIVNAAAIRAKELRLNIGAGHIALDDFVNVDMRELPGIDVVAPIDALPFEPGTITEIFSSHTIEHFPHEELRRHLLPYLVGMLKPGGTFRAVVPDLAAMAKGLADGSITFEEFRSVAYGGQEYEGDFHFDGFSVDSLSTLLVEAGLRKPVVIAQARPNGACLEFEIAATKPGE